MSGDSSTLPGLDPEPPTRDPWWLGFVPFVIVALLLITLLALGKGTGS